MMRRPWRRELDEEYDASVRRIAKPKESSASSDEPGRFRGFLSKVGNFYHRYVRGWSWQQIDRLREAKLREIESANEEREANAAAKRAEAYKLVTEADSIFRERERVIEVNAKLIDSRPDQSQAYDQLKRAIELIELKGGTVSFPSLPPTADDLDGEPGT